MNSTGPRAGEIVHVTGDASVQFAGRRAMYFRVIRIHDWPTYTGYLWLDGYQLNAAGDAVERRSIFVEAAGLSAVAIEHGRPAPGNRRRGDRGPI